MSGQADPVLQFSEERALMSTKPSILSGGSLAAGFHSYIAAKLLASKANGAGE